MLRVFHVLALTISLVAGSVAQCAGWSVSPHVRMACCSDGGCPMHQSKSQDEDAGVTQADADRCCTAGERQDSAPSSTHLAFAVTLVVTVSPVPVALSAPDQRVDICRGSPPLPSAHVSKHVLLSVFLL